MLSALGVDNYGINNVVGGFVGMFSIISSSLSGAISRFLTFEIGTGNMHKLKQVFATSLLIQICLALLIILATETIGLWYLNSKMSIPEGRETAALWVFELSVASFAIGLINVPYDACIVAHERMKTFAYMSLLEVSFKLMNCYLITITPFDRLISLAVFTLCTSLIIRFIYLRYCFRNFEECRTKIHFHKDIFKEMFGFAGWNFFNNTAYILNGQGVNMLINSYFGVALNAARGVAFAVEGSVKKFAYNFTTAVNPQITKTYAAGQLNEMYTLVCRAAKFSYFIMFLFALPLISEVSMVLKIWLKEVPDYTVIFVQLSLVMSLIDCTGNSGYTACMATGRLRKYSTIITSIGLLEFVLTWTFYSLGASVVAAYYTYIVVKFAVLVTRMFLLQDMVGLSCSMYIKKVFVPIFNVTIISIIPVILINRFIPESFLRLAISFVVGCSSVAITALYIGMTKNERAAILGKVADFRKRIFKR
jgi:O-antigen/teichoic acid export membrane protein